MDWKRFVIPGVIVLALVAAAFAMFRSEDQKTVTAIFPRTVALYEGSEVRVLGIPVGNVDKVEPQGQTVKVTMSYDADVDVPADATAVIISPSVVGDRYVQLTPVYSGDGPTLEDGAQLEIDRTSTPLELDEIYQSLDDLTVALGPKGANNDGALSELLQSTAANFGGQGDKFNQTLQNLGKFTATLENNKEELFKTSEHLEKFVSTLANNDKIVRDFNNSLAGVSDLLADERQELAASLQNLASALTDVHGFVRDNRDLLTENIAGLRKVTDVVVRRRAEFEEILRVAPLALNNLGATYNPQAGTLDTRANLGETLNQLQNNPALLLCTMVNQVNQSGEACDLINQILPRAATFGVGPAGEPDPIFSQLQGVTR